MKQPQIAGILNITPDSFSDGGSFLEPAKALAHARYLWDSGADIVDLGAASSRPGAESVPAEEERRRLAPVLEALTSEAHRLSVDSHQTPIQRYALSHGVAMLNDVQGFADAAFYPELAAAQCRLVVMHKVPEPEAPPPEPLFDALRRFFDKRLAALSTAGVQSSRIIIDPGMGLFLGRRRSLSFAALKAVKRLKEEYRLPVMISVSRKSFLRMRDSMTPQTAAAASLAAEIFAAAQGASYIRTHDPLAFADGWRVWQELA